MTLRQLEILRALIRHRTTVAAAEELHLSQPAVSNALKLMESQAELQLFHRINNRLFPTAEALTVHEEAEAIFALHTRLESRVRDLRENRSGRLSISSTPPLGYSVIPSALKRFLRPRPKTRVFFDVRRYEGVVDALMSRVAELGFALGLSPQPGIASEAVDTGDMVCVFAPGHPFTAKAAVSPTDFTGMPLIGLERGTWMGEALRASFNTAGAPFEAAVEVRYCNTACALAGAGIGAAVVDPFSPLQGGRHPLVVRPFVPATAVVSYTNRCLL